MRYRGPCFRKTRRLEVLSRLTCKRPKIGNHLKNQSCSSKKISISYSSRRKTKIVFSLYGLKNNNYLYTFVSSGKLKDQPGQVLLQLLGIHLDNIVFSYNYNITSPLKIHLNFFLEKTLKCMKREPYRFDP